MELTPLEIEGAWLVTSKLFLDDRGNFREWFKRSEILEKTGIDFQVEQANVSLSKRGVIRGIHYSLAGGGQAKWVTCVSGHIIDFVIDIRPDSPTFRKYVAIDLLGSESRAVFIGPGLGHGFIAIEDTSVVSYLLSSNYSPENEYEINPMDPELAIDWRLDLLSGASAVLSPKDSNAPTIRVRRDQNELPT